MGKRILITGASKGIGRELSIKLASCGYDLYLVARSLDELQKLQAMIQDEYRVDCKIRKCDVGVINEVEEVSEEIRTLGDLYGIVNNAAISKVMLITDMTYDEWQMVINTNLNSLFYITKNLAPILINKHEGKIINISSVWGNVGASTEVCYSASKGGVNSFTKALAKELAPSNVQVNAVAFGVIDTDMNKCFSKEDMDALASEIPADRIGTPKEAAQMIVQIIEAPEYLTGQIITMDGGWI